MKWPFRSATADPMPAPDDPHWERSLINRMAIEFLREQRRARRWGLIFKFGILFYLVATSIATLALFYASDLNDRLGSAATHTALIEIDGMIAADTEASADRVITALREAFEAEQAKGIILRINSPGGSPVQAGYINAEIRRLREKYPDKPVYAVAVDLCASGAYYVAVAADAIYVDKASLVGSIGVRMDSFGFQKAMEDLGVERRLLTAGEHKGILDPFLPLDPNDVDFIGGQLKALHQQFIAAVKKGRGARLTGGDELFSGLFWNGEESVTLGLADGLGSSGSVARDLIGAEDIVKYTKKRTLFDQFADRVGTAFAGALARTIAGERWMAELR